MKTKLMVLVLLVSVTLVGCMSVTAFDPGTSVPASDDFTALGNVTASVNVRSSIKLLFLPVISWGAPTVQAKKLLLEKAPPGTDDIINISYEENQFNVPGVYTRKSYVLQGTAVKYNN